MTTQKQLVLASASPRRRELLTQIGFPFQIKAADIPEQRRPDERPIPFVLRLAREKAQAVASQVGPDSVVLGADTVVVCEGEVLGKPADAADAKRMLRLLAGRTHQVITGVCVLTEEQIESAAEVTMVQMLTISEEEIEAYVATSEPMDKAGAYAIQGRAAKWIPRIQGCYFNVVGLPLALTTAMLETVFRSG